MTAPSAATRWLTGFAVAAVLQAGCVVEQIDLDDRRCDDDHPCVEGYICIEDICEREDNDDSGNASD